MKTTSILLTLKNVQTNNPIDSEVDIKKKTRKRLRQPQIWKKNKKKCLKNLGKSYVTYKGKVIQAKKLKAPCAETCRLQCSEKIDEDMRGTCSKGNSLPDTIKNGVSEHINTYPRKESHYCRSSTSREYLDGDLNLSLMYRQYKECLNTDGDRVVWNNIKKMYMQHTNPYIVFYLDTYLPNSTMKSFDVRHKMRSPAILEMTLTNKFRTRPPISDLKKKDLISLCQSKVIPRVYWDYYENLPASSELNVEVEHDEEE
ncbi:hypothetical protein ACJJTC_008909 [Scirpophaga incertulas]